jgi:hypothetical protein
MKYRILIGLVSIVILITFFVSVRDKETNNSVVAKIIYNDTTPNVNGPSVPPMPSRPGGIRDSIR